MSGKYGVHVGSAAVFDARAILEVQAPIASSQVNCVPDQVKHMPKWGRLRIGCKLLHALCGR
jgi:hypothetical protein